MKVHSHVEVFTQVIRRFIGSHYERHLFEDPDKLASLMLKPVVPGNYHVTGMVNHTHRIEPCENWERTSQKRLAHRI
ncbi:hypothetical protein MRX96_026000 [Rhipicephalus microplus]